MAKVLVSLLMIMMVPVQKNISGSWQIRDGAVTHSLIIVDNYFSITSFDQLAKKFLGTRGGTFNYSGDQCSGIIEFDSMEKLRVGSAFNWKLTLTGNDLVLIRDGNSERWMQVDNGLGSLAGNWRISGREQNGQMVEIKPAARKTIKLLSASRFQWAAINTETGEFFGSGGGTYTFKDGIYTEQIEFFSRDSSRVGMSLSFNGKVDGRNWHHSGKSSRGEPIHEVWSR